MKMDRLPNINEDLIVEVLLDANMENNYRFDYMELVSVLEYTIRKATKQYRDDSYLIADLLRNELHDYVMRKRFNDKKEREEIRCLASIATPIHT